MLFFNKADREKGESEIKEGRKGTEGTKVKRGYIYIYCKREVVEGNGLKGGCKRLNRKNEWVDQEKKKRKKMNNKSLGKQGEKKIWNRYYSNNNEERIRKKKKKKNSAWREIKKNISCRSVSAARKTAKSNNTYPNLFQ